MTGEGERPAVRIPARGRAAKDLNAEFEFHLDMRTRELIEKGMNPAVARAEARRQFGDIIDAQAYCRDIDQRRENRMLRRERLSELTQDIAYALRTLRKTPAFTLVALITLALGIGATTSIFSVVSGILLRPLPFADPKSLVMVASTYNGQVSTSSPANIADFRAQASSFAGIATIESSPAILTGEGDPVRLSGAAVSGDFFSILGVPPIIGRSAFTPEESAFGGPKSVLLNESLWRSRFGADSTIVGRMITLDGESHQVIGIIPAVSASPSSAQIWTAYSYDPAQLEGSRGAVYLSMMARLKPGVSVQQAEADMRAVASRLAVQYPNNNTALGAAVIPLHTWIAGDLRRPLLILLGGVGFVLLIACANVANLQLVRGVTRETELAVRAALGAGRGRLIRQLVTENVVLALAGGALGFGLAIAGTKFFVAAAPPSIPRLSAIRVDGMVLAFTMILALVTGVTFGLVPARQLLRANLISGLREAGRAGHRVATNRARRSLVVAEVALSVLLLAGAGLLIRSFDRLMHVDPGFATKNAMTFSLSLPAASYQTPESQNDFVNQLLQRIESVPGVTGVGAALGMPLTPFSFGFSFTIAGRPVDPKDEPAAQVRVATPGYLNAMGIPIVRGRGFTDADRGGGAGVLLIAETAAKEFFPNEDPIGKHVRFGWGQAGRRLEGDIVGIVADVKQSSLAQATMPQFWAPLAQRPVASFTVVMRTDGNPRSVAAAARAAVHDLDRNLPVNSERTLGEIVDLSVAQPRFYMTLLTVFSLVALVMCAIGVYGVIAYLVSQREREIGIRVALGASRSRVARLVLSEGVMMVAAGVAIGIGGALALTRVMAGLLFDITPTDGPAYAIAVGVLAIVALVASIVPALRAARVDPLIAMRAD